MRARCLRAAGLIVAGAVAVAACGTGTGTGTGTDTGTGTGTDTGTGAEVGWFDPGPDRAQLGFDAPFEVRVAAGVEAAGGTIEWRLLSGVGEWRAEDRGWRLVGRTPTLAQARPGPLPAGIVAFSPATRGELIFEATWRGPGHVDVRRELRVAATARASGVPSVGVGHAVVLAGVGWRLAERPRGARADLAPRGEVTVLVPDETGRWLLVDAGGGELPLRVGRAGDVPLDCGRTECHPRIAAVALDSPMPSVLARGLDGALGAAYDPRCAIACHAVGEPGLHDGGFTDTAAELGFALPPHGAPGTWAALPRALRRVGGVGCGACHGPAAVAERPARWSILRADVCAVCHDAPPRYGHVAAWRTGRMARADAAPGVTAAPCARCHTTAGFLASLGVRAPRDGGSPPADAGPIGIACAACHAPHGDHLGKSLVRRIGAADSPTALCRSCHETTLATAPCLDCHNTDHSFRAVPSAAARRVREQTAALAARAGIPIDRPAHVTNLPAAGTPLRLLLDDPAAGAHDPERAAQLLGVTIPPSNPP